MRILRYLALALALLGGRTGTARAGMNAMLFNTGVSDSGSLLAEGSVDPHYQLISSADPQFPGPSALVVLSTGHPISNDWPANGPDSQWIAPQANQDENNGGGNAPGDYAYRTTFDLTGFDPALVRITGRWSMDNSGVDILINGAPTGSAVSGDGFHSFHDFSINGGFVAGVNTLDFLVVNEGGPTGLRVELSGTTVAEPGGWLLMGVAAAVMSAFGRCRQRHGRV